MRMTMALVVACGAGFAWADDVAVIDLTGLKVQDGLDQIRTSAPDTIDPATSYEYVIEGKVKGSGVVFGLLFPEPTPLGDALDTFEPGLSDLLSGSFDNPSGLHPVVVFDATFEGEQNLGGIDVQYAATLTAGIDEEDLAYFSITGVNLEPSFLVGSLTFTEGTATIVRVSGCIADFNGDGMLNILDFVAFQSAFTSGDAGADCNQDGALNVLDFVCFQSTFVGGCR